MKVIRAKHAGFCYGVQRATRLAFELESQGVSPIFSLGPLMHNPQEVDRLSKHGILPRERIDDCIGGKTLIRTHGISKEEQRRAKLLGVDLVDSTCPHVKVPRRHLEACGLEQRVVLLVGDQDHPEVRALLSYATGPVVVLGDAEEIPDLDPVTRVAVVAQTTQSKQTFSRVVAAARGRFHDTVVVDTVCQDARLRQEEALRLARQVDLMVVVGGHNSANTCRLAGICRAIQKRTYQVECADELRGVSINQVETIGLVSGASTPEWIIAEVNSWLRSRPG